MKAKLLYEQQGQKTFAVVFDTGTPHGGHLIEARVRPTLELIVVESPEHLVRKTDDETGLALIDL